MVPEGWQRGTYGDMLVETDERAGEATDLPVLSVTKTRGPMLASERFGRVMHGRDLTKYRVARRSSIVADPMLLWDGSIGVQAVVDAGLVSPDYRVYAPTERARSDFLAHLVRSPQMLPHYQGGARGTNVRRNRIARSDFLKIPALVPPLGEQKRIAAILSSVDEAIDSTQSVVEQLQGVKKALLIELLTRGLPGCHTEFKASPIGRVPRDWDVCQITDVGEVMLGRMRSPVYSTGTNRPYLRVANVLDDRIDTSNVLEMPFEDDQFSKFRLQTGDILLNEGQSLELVGRSAIYEGNPPDCAFQKTLLRFRPSSRVNGRFVQTVFQWFLYTGRFAENAVQTTSIAHLTGVRFSAMKMPVPPLDEQQAIADVFDSLRKRVAAEEKVVSYLRHVKKLLSDRLFAGEIRVTPTPEAP